MIVYLFVFHFKGSKADERRGSANASKLSQRINKFIAHGKHWGRLFNLLVRRLDKYFGYSSHACHGNLLIWQQYLTTTKNWLTNRVDVVWQNKSRITKWHIFNKRKSHLQICILQFILLVWEKGSGTVLYIHLLKFNFDRTRSISLMVLSNHCDLKSENNVQH